MDNLVRRIVKSLAKYSPEVIEASTGSIYIMLTGSKVRQIRVANHPGNEPKRNCWELRSDVCTKRYGSVRVYNNSAIDRLIADIK